MNTSRAQNRRENFRVNRDSEHSWQLSVDDALITRNVVDISATGLRFKAPSHFKFDEGQVLKLNVTLEPGDTFECEGRVLWMRSSIPESSTMNTVGVQFEKLPTRVDTFIVQELYKQALKARWKDGSNYKISPRSATFETGINLGHIVKQAFTVALTVSFLIGVRFYEKSHPQDSLEFKFNQGLAQKLKGLGYHF